MDIFTIDKSINIIDLIKNIRCGFCIYSTKLQHIEFNIWNKYMIEITGYTMKEINKIGWDSILCNTHPISDFIGSVNIHQDKEYEIISKNGVRKIISMSTSIINTEDGEDNNWAIVKDITKNKQVEQNFKEIEEGYEKVLELSTDCILIHKDEKYIYVNNNTYKLLGIENPEDIIGQSIYKYVSPNFHDVVKNRVTIELETEGSIPIIEETFITTSGEVIYVEVASSYAPYQGNKCIFTFIRNITYRKKLEDQLRKSELLLLQVTENSLDMITICDMRGIIKY